MIEITFKQICFTLLYVLTDRISVAFTDGTKSCKVYCVQAVLLNIVCVQ